MEHKIDKIIFKTKYFNIMIYKILLIEEINIIVNKHKICVLYIYRTKKNRNVK